MYLLINPDQEKLEINLSAKWLSGFLRELGQDRARIVEFCRSFNLDDGCILIDFSPLEQTVYEYYKQRNAIEEMFDSCKNYLDANTSYMQNRYVLERRPFANFIAMIACYKLYVRLRQAELLTKRLPKDIIEQSKVIYKMKIIGQWFCSEITQKTQKLFAKIGLDWTT